jgi:hypothetical protein
MLISSLILMFLQVQDSAPLKPPSEFEIITNYQLKTKPAPENTKIVFDEGKEKMETGSDLLPYLTIQIKVKRWKGFVEQIKIVDAMGKTRLKKKVTDSGIYDLDMGYVDDMKDGVTSGKFFIHFLEGKKIIEQITISVEEDGTFLVNNEKRGKF